MAWIALGGVVLQVGGLWLAVKGIADTYHELLHEPIWPALREAAKDWFLHEVLRRPRPPVNLSAHATAALGVAAAGSVTTPLPDVDDSMTVDVRISALARSIEILESRIHSNRDRHDSQHKRLDSWTRNEIRKLTDELQQARTEIGSLQRATVGPGGQGLVEAVAGILITMVGVILTVAGLPF